VNDASPLKKVLLTTPEAEQLARRLGAPEVGEPDGATHEQAGSPGR
jgi:hypothetical protein